MRLPGRNNTEKKFLDEMMVTNEDKEKIAHGNVDKFLKLKA